MQKIRLGFALEGNSDYPVIPRLARRVIMEEFSQVQFAEDSVLRPRKRGHGFISELPTFVQQLQDDHSDIVIAIVDTDNTLQGERLALLRKAKERCVELGLTVCIADGLAVRKLEAWLLADEAAVFKVFDGDRTSVNFPAPEENHNPKNTLNRIVRTLTSDREVTFASFAQDLANAIRLSVLRQKCSHFDKFAHNLMNCVKEWQRINQ